MTSNEQNNAFLRRTLSELLPDAFSHPVWIHLVRNGDTYSPDFIQYALHSLQLEQEKDDVVSNCQVLFLCAYLQSRLGENDTALASIEQAWKLAETHGLHQIACCAAWGGCAICVRGGDYEKASHWLRKLQEKLRGTHEWVLINVLELFKQILEAPVPDTNGELFDWLLHWGEWPPPETAYPSESGHRTQLIAFPRAGIVLRFTRRWKSFWRSIRYIARGKWLLQQSPDHSELAKRDENQDKATSPKPQASQSDGKIFSSTTASFSENSQIQIGVSDVSAPLLQLHTTPSSHPPPSTPQQPDLPSLAVYCLGQFRIYQDEQLINTWPSGKGKAIFKYMIANFGRPISRDVLMDIFWREADLEAARRNLHQAVYSLRLTLRGGYPDYQHIRFENESYSLNPDMIIWIDYQEFEKHARAGRRLEATKRLEEAMAEYGIAEALYQGDFLEEDLYEDWANSQRDHFRSIYLDMVDHLVSYYIKRGEYSPAIALCQKTLAKDDCHESAHRSLIQCYMAQGQRHLAVRQYHACVEALKNGLNLEPSRETTSLYHRIRSAP